MNMNFQRPHGFELRQAQLRTMESSSDESTTKKHWTKYAAFTLVTIGAFLFVANSSARTLLIIGGVIVALVGLATFVCIRAQNETPYW